MIWQGSEPGVRAAAAAQGFPVRSLPGLSGARRRGRCRAADRRASGRQSQLRDLHALADELGMAALVEVHDAAELETALTPATRRWWASTTATCTTFSVQPGDDLELPRRTLPAEVCVVAESGIHTPADVATVAAIPRQTAGRGCHSGRRGAGDRAGYRRQSAGAGSHGQSDQSRFAASPRWRTRWRRSRPGRTCWASTSTRPARATSPRRPARRSVAALRGLRRAGHPGGRVRRLPAGREIETILDECGLRPGAALRARSRRATWRAGRTGLQSPPPRDAADAAGPGSPLYRRSCPPGLAAGRLTARGVRRHRADGDWDWRPRSGRRAAHPAGGRAAPRECRRGRRAGAPVGRGCGLGRGIAPGTQGCGEDASVRARGHGR